VLVHATDLPSRSVVHADANSCNNRIVAEQPRVEQDRQSTAFLAGNACRAVEKTAENEVASIRSVHGKRLLASVPLENLFNTIQCEQTGAGIPL